MENAGPIIIDTRTAEERSSTISSQSRWLTICSISLWIMTTFTRPTDFSTLSWPVATTTTPKTTARTSTFLASQLISISPPGL